MRGGGVRWIARAIGRLAIAFLALSVALALVYRVVEPPLTPLMVIRRVAAWSAGKSGAIERETVPIERISPALQRAVIASEDASFFRHHGIDFDELRRARAYNERQHGRRLRGASTITMQTARNVFLWPDRTWVRKGFEIYFTGLLEIFWSKRRILEVYLNAVEWGDGVYGAEAAARRWFGIPASHLDPRQAALLAAALPSPRSSKPAAPSAYLRRTASRVQARAARVDLGPLL